MSYVAKAQIGGKLAQIGSRLVDGAAAKLADDFFARFVTRLAPARAGVGDAATSAAHRHRRMRIAAGARRRRSRRRRLAVDPLRGDRCDRHRR